MKVYKCRQCTWLNTGIRISIGCKCECPNIEHKGLAMWKQPCAKACKKGFNEKPIINNQEKA